ncbi:RNA polymerase sigma factor [Cohnella faecalis]|uniref:RNA polymerase sigma factor n=1 Tax=Cohnella faecalis TaxID=2315694 RepID=A0A398CPI1_9BACL|nr:RNA polymerase sigma factor [Cohnella faecalis]RIE04070.1 RNA polymerase sigma factor [Cohnella faecalis]
MSFLREPDPIHSLWTEEEVMGELYRQMLRVARSKLYNKGDAGDVVQEAWVRILENGHSLREADKLFPWARTIASNLASSANRSRRRLETVYEGYAEFLRGGSQSAEPELIAVLSDALGRLDPATRTLLLYKFYYGFKDDEIATALDVPVGTVKARIHRSKARLKSNSNDEGYPSNT